MKNTPQTQQVSHDEFVRTLGATGLFSGDELLKLLSALPAAANSDAASLATHLTSVGRLTAFQVEAVLDRRGESLLFGNYEVLERLGSGGMGTVYKARHRRMKRVVAIKVLSRAVAADPTFLFRFQREVETVARLSHPNIVMAFDADEADIGPYLVMEFVNGRDLASRVQAEGPLRVADAVDCVLQAARGLAYAHAQGIVHRDIKPANLLQDISGVVKVADLGLARLSDARMGPAEPGSGSLTQAGSVVGTVDFMPPEQAMDSTIIDHRADIYSLGCTLYYLLTGKPPYVAGTLMGTLLKHQGASIPTVSVERPETPPALDEIIHKMLAKMPADRYAKMDEVVQELEQLLLSLSAVRPPTMTGQRVAENDAHPTILDRARPRTTPAPIAPPAAPAKSRSALLVEPSRTQAMVVRKYLQDLGIADVQTAPSKQKALELIRATTPDMILSAMHLADSTGVELVKQLRAEPALAQVGFVLISSETDEGDLSAVRTLPHTVLLKKPFDLPKLEEALGVARAAAR